MFDLAVPYSLPQTDEALANALTEALKEKDFPLNVEIHIDRRE